MRISALVSGYYSEDFIETRLINLAKHPVETILVCQAGSAEQEIGRQYGVKIHLTYNVPTLYKAWNLAIEDATGEYLVVANTDDLFHDGMLERMAEHLDKTGADILYTDYDIKGEKSKSIDRYYRTKHKPSELTHVCFIGPMPMWRKSLHERFGMFNETFTIVGDWEFWARCVLKGKATLAYLPESVGVYWSRPNSLEHKDTKKHNEERKRVKGMYRG